MKIAVVGSGIAGLSAAWLLSHEHDVTIFEKADRLGMDAHALDLGKSARIDVPLRVFFDGFYPNLTALYERLGINSQPINYSASFGHLDQRSYFRYDNYKLGRLSLPFLKGRPAFNAQAMRISWDLLRFFRGLRQALNSGLPDQLTLADYLKQGDFSRQFAEGFLYPAFAGICTCSHRSIRNYPARVVLDYLDTGLLFSSVRRVTQGTQEVVNRLAAGVSQTHLGTEVREILPIDGGIQIITDSGATCFEQVIVASQANQSLRLLGRVFAEEREVLSTFPYESSDVIVHQDERLAPPGGPSQWAPVNFLLDGPGTTPMATIWMNAIQDMPENETIFQSWNPIIDPDPDTILARSRFERPLVTADSLKAQRRLETLHQQPGRRLWFCGSYAAYGIPLLESASHSALTVAERLGSQRPWC